jgi:hypothetical protein
MLLKIALVLLAAWLVGVLGVYSMGKAVHVLLLVGLMLLLLGFLRAREAVITAARDVEQTSKTEPDESRVAGRRVR